MISPRVALHHDDPANQSRLCRGAMPKTPKYIRDLHEPYLMALERCLQRDNTNFWAAFDAAVRDTKALRHLLPGDPIFGILVARIYYAVVRAAVVLSVDEELARLVGTDHLFDHVRVGLFACAFNDVDLPAELVLPEGGLKIARFWPGQQTRVTWTDGEPSYSYVPGEDAKLARYRDWIWRSLHGIPPAPEGRTEGSGVYTEAEFEALLKGAVSHLRSPNHPQRLTQKNLSDRMGMDRSTLIDYRKRYPEAYQRVLPSGH